MVAQDPHLAQHSEGLVRRWLHYEQMREKLVPSGHLRDASAWHKHVGFQNGTHNGVDGVWFREWAPAAQAMHLIGDFNDWDRNKHPLVKGKQGIWSIFLPQGVMQHGDRVKVQVTTDLANRDRIPSTIRRVIQDTQTMDFAGVYWDPPPYQWQSDRPARPNSLRIYEVHVGMSSERKGIATFPEFSRDVLFRVKRLGYNAIQLMACMQHPYYGSFGYQVSNFFAVSHMFGTPEELKGLVDQAHSMGISVLMDLVHSHAVSNTHEGLNLFDGSPDQYFHSGSRGDHPAWDSKCFDYGKPEVLKFLLSNVRFWLEEFRLDGFRFDGVTSMIYRDHGLNRQFTHYGDYFDVSNTDEDAVVYLQLANELIHELVPGAMCIAEEVSGLPGLARPIEEGGLGFDYRLMMGVPDHWIKLLKDQRDEDWQMGELVGTLTNRRRNEAHVAYCESHDQALVGDKTIAFRLMDAQMYVDMEIGRPNPVIDRGIALHKMIRLITFAMAGEAWLNFMGNEFGHPDWVDFPREGNQYSYHHARRQWSLVDSPFLRYGQLNAFDQAMQHLDDRFGILSEPNLEILGVHENRKLIVFRRGTLIFLFNFHVWQSQAKMPVQVPQACAYSVVLNSDDQRFGGMQRVHTQMTYSHQKDQSVHVYLPARTCQVLAPVQST
ncbi:MAG: alpha amylase C-terminal domain-containing protein [Acidobacteria bacterium]|nr:alpha amylase C-terminal domain-containing protein [Acidobacteriota bacterium]